MRSVEDTAREFWNYSDKPTVVKKVEEAILLHETEWKDKKIDEILQANNPMTRSGMVCTKHSKVMVNYCIGCWDSDIKRAEEKLKSFLRTELDNKLNDYKLLGMHHEDNCKDNCKDCKLFKIFRVGVMKLFKGDVSERKTN